VSVNVTVGWTDGLNGTGSLRLLKMAGGGRVRGMMTGLLLALDDDCTEVRRRLWSVLVSSAGAVGWEKERG
jgi:hypothetical protein